MTELPRSVAGKFAPVFIRQAPRRGELYHAGIVKQKDRCTLTAQRFDDRVERRLMNILIRAGSV